MLAEIVNAPEFAEICFLVAFILFVIDVIVRFSRPANWAFEWLMISAGLAFCALGFLALPQVAG